MIISLIKRMAEATSPEADAATRMKAFKDSATFFAERATRKEIADVICTLIDLHEEALAELDEKQKILQSTARMLHAFYVALEKAYTEISARGEMVTLTNEELIGIAETIKMGRKIDTAVKEKKAKRREDESKATDEPV